MHGDIDALQKLANDNPEGVATAINTCTLGVTPLHAAIQRNHLDVVNFLLNNGADPDLMTEHGVCPLDIAVFTGNIELVIALLSHQASSNRSDKEGNSPVMLAAYNGDFDILCVLVDNGASTIRCNNQGMDTEDVLYNVHGKTLVQAVSEGATMRAQQSALQRVVRYIEMGWGVSSDGREQLLPLADAEELVRESGILDRVDTAGLWMQVIAEVSHVTRKDSDTASPTTTPKASTTTTTTGFDEADGPEEDVPEQGPETMIGFEQFMSTFRRFIRCKTNRPDTEDRGLAGLVKNEKEDATTLPFSQQLIDYTKHKIKAVYASDSSHALRLLWGDPQSNRTNTETYIVRLAWKVCVRFGEGGGISHCGVKGYTF